MRIQWLGLLEEFTKKKKTILHACGRSVKASSKNEICPFDVLQFEVNGHTLYGIQVGLHK